MKKLFRDSSLLNLLSIVQLILKKSQKRESFDSVDISVQKQLIINKFQLANSL